MSVVMKERRQSTPQPIAFRWSLARGGKNCSQWSVVLRRGTQTQAADAQCAVNT